MIVNWIVNTDSYQSSMGNTRQKRHVGGRTGKLVSLALRGLRRCSQPGLYDKALFQQMVLEQLLAFYMLEEGKERRRRRGGRRKGEDRRRKKKKQPRHKSQVIYILHKKLTKNGSHIKYNTIKNSRR